MSISIYQRIFACRRASKIGPLRNGLIFTSKYDANIRRAQKQPGQIEIPDLASTLTPDSSLQKRIKKTPCFDLILLTPFTSYKTTCTAANPHSAPPFQWRKIFPEVVPPSQCSAPSASAAVHAHTAAGAHARALLEST